MMRHNGTVTGSTITPVTKLTNTNITNIPATPTHFTDGTNLTNNTLRTITPYTKTTTTGTGTRTNHHDHHHHLVGVVGRQLSTPNVERDIQNDFRWNSTYTRDAKDTRGTGDLTAPPEKQATFVKLTETSSKSHQSNKRE